MSRLLNVGGGSKEAPLPSRYEGWEQVLLDVRPAPTVDLVADALWLGTIAEVADSFDGVWCSHALEHFYLHDVPQVLAGFHHALRDHGSVHIVVPDVGLVAKRIAEGAGLDDVAYESAAGPITWGDMLHGYGPDLATSGNDHYAHKTAFTEARLRRVLEEAGFADVQVTADETLMHVEAIGFKGGHAPLEVIPGSVVLGWLPQPIAGTTVVQQTFFDSFFAYVTHDTAHRKAFLGYVQVGTGYIASARDTVCAKFLTTQGEWLLMLDWDVTFSPECVYELLDAADPKERPIIAGCYVTFFGEGSKLRPCWMLAGEDGQQYAPDELRVGEIIECATVGMGFTLIHRSVLEAMQRVYSLEDNWAFFGHDMIGGVRTGEDVTFCNRARKLGFTSWGHGGVLLGHTKAKTFVPSDIAER